MMGRVFAVHSLYSSFNFLLLFVSCFMLGDYSDMYFLCFVLVLPLMAVVLFAKNWNLALSGVFENIKF
jgi:hypothetical protein